MDRKRKNKVAQKKEKSRLWRIHIRFGLIYCKPTLPLPEPRVVVFYSVGTLLHV